MAIDPKALAAYAGTEDADAPPEEAVDALIDAPEEEDEIEVEDRAPAAQRLAGSYAVLLSAAEDIGDELANDGSPLDEGIEEELLDALDSMDDETLLALADLEPDLGVSDYTTMVLTMQAQNEEAPDTDAARLVGALLYHARLALTGDEPVVEEPIDEDAEAEEAEEEPEEEAPAEGDSSEEEV